MKLLSIRAAWRRGGAALAGAALVAAAATVAGPAAPAGAAVKPGAVLKATYPVTGSTYVAAPGATLPLGPGKLAAAVNLNTGKLTATLTLPDATGSFKQFGLIPVTATAQFINDGPTTGTVDLNTGATQATSTITLRLVSLEVAGIPVPVGSSCETSSPVSVTVTSQPGFNPLTGGTLSGSYTLPAFSGCGLATLLINLTLPGPGNTISLTLGKAHLKS